MTCAQLINHMEGSCRQSSGWRAAHWTAWSAPHPIAGIIKAMGRYADDHKQRFGSAITADGVLGPAFEEMCESVRTLLNGDIGGLDGGTLDNLLYNFGYNLE